MTCRKCGRPVRLTRYGLGHEGPPLGNAHHYVVPTPLSEPVLSEDRARSRAPRPIGAAERR